MRIVIAVLIFALSGCSSVKTCGSKSYVVTLPSGIPFVDGDFTFQRISDHVDCSLDPAERQID